MLKKRKRRLLSGVIRILVVLTMAACNFEETEDFTNNEIQPLYKLILIDGGEVAFYSDSTGCIITLISTSSENIFEDISSLNCIEICEKYGDGFIPDNIKNAYDKYVELYGEEENEDKISNSEEYDETLNSNTFDGENIHFSGVASYSPVHPRRPQNIEGLTFERFCRQSAWEFDQSPLELIRNTKPGFYEYEEVLPIKNSDFRDDVCRMAIKNMKKNITTKKWSVDYIATCYVVSGAMKLKLERLEGFSLFGVTVINRKWYTLGNFTFTKGQYGGYHCVGSGDGLRTKYRVKAQILPKYKNSTIYHLFLYAIRY